jgi:hypothetical protein
MLQVQQLAHCYVSHALLLGLLVKIQQTAWTQFSNLGILTGWWAMLETGVRPR